MAIDVTGLNFLAFAKKNGVDFSSVLTLGRQSVHVRPPEVLRVLELANLSHLVDKLSNGDIRGAYCEELLELAFGAKTVDSIDASNYEDATIVHNLNWPVAPSRKYSVILDLGCLEHIFNVPVALSNIVALCDTEGHIVHVLPSNNLCGHGFYQFSPEFFFAMYAEERGFRNTKIFVAELGNTSRWYRVRSPQEIGTRVSITTAAEMYVLVMTQRTESAVTPLVVPPEQFDYRAAWCHSRDRRRDSDSSFLRRALINFFHAMPWAYNMANGIRRRMALRKTFLSNKVGDVELVDVEAVLGKRATK